MTAQSSRANYGVDAPGVMLGLMGAGAGGVALGALAIWFGPHWAITLIGAVVAAGAVVPLVLGLAMGAYALLGKGRTRVWLLSHHNWRGDERVLDVGAGRGF
ncbi:MAG: hypothetical protein EBU97_00995, partial [Rhodobacteraceae bacterium]|nr:hypothetical protein [Paracoccaceae bacterium]